MVNKKVTLAMIERWQSEINRRIYQERKTNIIKEIAKREVLNYTTVYYWVSPQRYREKMKQNARDYRQEHLEECNERSRKYYPKYRQKQIEDMRSNPNIRVQICARARLHRKVESHIDELLPEIIPNNNLLVTAEEMVDRLRHISGGITVKPTTLERSIKNYLAHNPNPIVKEVTHGEYIRI